jgi:protein-S-isoprenylcysteine O-methyltransferase Ste14
MNLNWYLDKIKATALNFIAVMIPFFQFIPCASIWFGIMSLPLISYLINFLSYPGILLSDFKFFFGYPGTYVALLGGVIFLISLVYQLTHWKGLIQKGPYKYVRHPQYLGIIIMTFGLTMICLNTSPVFPFIHELSNELTWVVSIWIIEALIYLLLAGIEDLYLESKYKGNYLEYKNTVAFIIPFLKLKKKDKLKRISS